MVFNINNYEIGKIHFRPDNGLLVYPERFWKTNGAPCRFELREGRESFRWRGIPGERYQAYAPLNSECWGDDVREAFAHWRLAVFAPADIEHSHRITPIVFTFAGIGDDYFKNELYLPTIVNELGCIFVAFDPHMTGDRIFGPRDWDPLRMYAKNIQVLEEKGHTMNDDYFREFTEELTFNVLQITSMICERFGLPEMPPCITLGFSLGGFFSHQIAMQTPHCFGCVGGGAAPDIMLYGGGFGLARMIPNFAANLLSEVLPVPPEFASLIRVIKNIKRTPYPDKPVQPHVECHFVIGSKDEHFFTGKVLKYCKALPYNVQASIIDGDKHTPCHDGFQFNGVGSGMMHHLTQLVHKWRSYR